MQSETAYKVHTPEIEPMGSANCIPNTAKFLISHYDRKSAKPCDEALQGIECVQPSLSLQHALPVLSGWRDVLSVSLCSLGVCRLGFKTHLGKSEEKGQTVLVRASGHVCSGMCFSTVSKAGKVLSSRIGEQSSPGFVLCRLSWLQSLSTFNQPNITPRLPHGYSSVNCILGYVSFTIRQC